MFWRSHVAEKAALLYLVVSAAWIVFSDQLVELFFPEDSAALQTGKGIFFVLVMTAGIYLLLRLLVRRRTALEERYAAETIAGQLMDDVLAERELRSMLADLSARLCRTYQLEDIWILQPREDGSLPVIAEGTGKARDLPVDPEPDLTDFVQKALRQGQPVFANAKSSSSRLLHVLPARLSTSKAGSPGLSAAFPLMAGETAVGVLVCFEQDAGQQARRLSEIFEDVARSIAVAWQANEQDRQLLLQDKALSEVANAILIADSAGAILWVNRAFERITGFTRAEVVGQPMHQLRANDSDGQFQERFWRTVLSGKAFKGELLHRHKDGTLISVYQTITPIHAASGSITHLIAIQEDITARKQAEERLMHLARHDLLTGLPNRAAFNEHVDELASSSRANGHSFAVLLLDIAQLGRVNENWGHETGDKVLIETARRLQDNLKVGSFLARYGNDEFVIVHPYETGLNVPMKLAQDLLDAISPVYTFPEAAIHCEASIGIALFPQDARQTGQLLRNAELALRRAEQERGLSYCFFSAEIDAGLRHRTQLREELYSALDRDELQLLYQPQLHLERGEIIGAEALLRWRHPLRGLLAPGAFLDVAEESELIQKIGRRVIEKALQQGAQWEREGRQLRVAINLSFAQFSNPELVDDIEQELRQCGLSPYLLELELTESMLAKDMEQAATMLERLHALGLSIAVDDFGTGYSSLSYLYQYRVDRLKIDRSFVRGIGQDETSSAIAEAVIALGHTLGMKVIAEGVENEAQLHYLNRLGCDEAQGFLISPPLPPGDFTQAALQQFSAPPRQAGMS
ncbi:EAL domain-containing protein [Fodinicurvata halophila]|uniref:EAL domain-containing protein n=1 Tax=Fodinicurvata halophila TaxID=1419723 RepID=A0ABV8UJX8_9PROT